VELAYSMVTRQYRSVRQKPRVMHSSHWPICRPTNQTDKPAQQNNKSAEMLELFPVHTGRRFCTGCKIYYAADLLANKSDSAISV